MGKFNLSVFWLGVLVLAFAGCQPSRPLTPEISRFQSIPSDLVKMTPDTDLFPPILHSDEWEDPIPLNFPINTAGGEDSPFITPDGKSLYFFFTPDVSVSAELQVVDGATGIYVSTHQEGIWSEPERIILNDPGKISLDGCQFVQGNEMWFCSARAGNLREIDFWRASFRDGIWTDFSNVAYKK